MASLHIVLNDNMANDNMDMMLCEETKYQTIDDIFNELCWSSSEEQSPISDDIDILDQVKDINSDPMFTMIDYDFDITPVNDITVIEEHEQDKAEIDLVCYERIDFKTMQPIIDGVDMGTQTDMTGEHFELLKIIINPTEMNEIVMDIIKKSLLE